MFETESKLNEIQSKVNRYFDDYKFVADTNNHSNLQNINHWIELEKSSILSDFTNIFKLLHYEYYIYRRFNSFIWTISCLRLVLTKHEHTKNELNLYNQIIEKYQPSFELNFQFKQALEDLTTLIENDMIIEEKEEENFHLQKDNNYYNSPLNERNYYSSYIDNSHKINQDDLTSKIQNISLSQLKLNSKHKIPCILNSCYINENYEDKFQLSPVKATNDFYNNITQSTKTKTDGIISNSNGLENSDGSSHMDIVYSPNIRNKKIFDIISVGESNENKLLERKMNQKPSNTKFYNKEIKISEFTLEENQTKNGNQSLLNSAKKENIIKTLTIKNNSVHSIQNRLQKKNICFSKEIFSNEHEQTHKTRRSLTRRKYKFSRKILISNTKSNK